MHNLRTLYVPLHRVSALLWWLSCTTHTTTHHIVQSGDSFIRPNLPPHHIPTVQSFQNHQHHWTTTTHHTFNACRSVKCYSRVTTMEWNATRNPRECFRLCGGGAVSAILVNWNSNCSPIAFVYHPFTRDFDGGLALYVLCSPRGYGHPPPWYTTNILTLHIRTWAKKCCEW